MGVHVYRDVRIGTDPDVYEPSDDSHMLADAVLDEAPDRLLEVGTGTGLVAILAARAGSDVVATDATAEATRLARLNARRTGAAVDVVRADLLAGIDAAAFDLVAFNPPYLPTGEKQRLVGPINRAFDGGPTGRRVVARFLEELPAEAPALLVASSKQDLDALRARIDERGRTCETAAERKLPGFERLVVWRLG